MSPHEDLVAHVARLDGESARWEALAVELESEATQVDAGAGDALLDDPEAQEHLVGHLAALRDRGSLARRAASTAAERAVVARRAVAACEAEQAVGPLAQAVAALAAHDKRTGTLLKALEDFTGADYRQVTLAMLMDEQESATGSRFGAQLRHPKRRALQGEVGLWERRQAAARAAAAGQDPRVAVEGLTFVDLPPCLRPGGVLDVGMVAPEDAEARDQAALAAEIVEAQVEVDAARAVMDELVARPHNPFSDLSNEMTAAQKRIDEALARWHTARARAGEDTPAELAS